MIKFAHISDTHLGFNDFDIVDDKGINQREVDVYNAFSNAISKIIDLKPDFVVHTGDLFHRSSPSNRALIEGIKNIKRLTDNGIPFIVISGNHSTPKTIYTSPIIEALNSIDGVYAYYNQCYDSLIIDGIKFHCIPFINEYDKLNNEIDKIKIAQGTNILLMHISLGKEYFLDEYGEMIYPPEKYNILNQFNYVGLGHWHSFNILSRFDNVCYSGATERFSDKDAAIDKGFALIELENDLKIDFITINTRPWVKVEINDCDQLTVNEIKKNIVAYSEKVSSGSIVSLYLNNISTHQSVEINNLWIKEQFENALIVNVKRLIKNINSNIHFSAKSIPVEQLFSKYCKEQLKNDNEAEEIINLANKYFIKYKNKNEDMKDKE